MAGQYVDGLRAPLILHSPTEKTDFKYDEEYTVGLSDWYHAEHKPLLDHYLSIFNPLGIEPIPEAALINEKQNEKFVFAVGKTYRLRFISMTALSMFHVWIDGHSMTIIEVDGINVQPYTVETLSVSSAQRYSVLVTAKSSSTFNYKLNAAFDLMMFDSPPPGLNPLVSALLVYDPSYPTFEATSTPEPTLFNELILVPLVPIPSSPADLSLVYDVNFALHDDGINHGTFNNIVYHTPLVPSIFSAMSLGQQALDQGPYGSTTNSKVLPHLAMVEIIINNLDAGSHPFHLHGHAFQIVAKGDAGPYSVATDGATSLNAQANPVRRDTVVVPGGGYAIIRFRADNPGVWVYII